MSKKNKGSGGSGWTKSYGVTSNLDLNGPINALLKLALLGGAALVGYFYVWPMIQKFLTGKDPPLTGSCPTGYHLVDSCKDLTGLPYWLCKAGSFTLGTPGCEKDTPVPPPVIVDVHGCRVDTQHWCDTDKQCRDLALSCTPSGENPDCQEWDPFHNIWLYSPTKCRPCPTGTHRDLYECKPDIVKPCSIFNGNNGDPQTCPDGSKVCDLRSCSTNDLCSPIGVTRCVNHVTEKCMQGSGGLNWFSTGGSCNMPPPPITGNCVQAGGACFNNQIGGPSGWWKSNSYTSCPTGYGCWFPGSVEH